MKNETSTIVDMHQSRRQDPDQDGEIDLREYIAVAVKRKNIVLAIFAGAVLIAAVRSFTAPSVYEVSTLIGPPIIGVSDVGSQELDSVGNMKGQIESGAFDGKIINELRLDEDSLKFSITQPRDSKILKISLVRPADKTDLAKKMLTSLVAALNANYTQFIEDKRNRIENQIKLTQSKIVRIENEMKLKGAQFKVLADKEQQSIDDLKEAKTRSDKFLADQARNENRDAGSSLLYVTTIQQNTSYLAQLKTEVSETRIQKETALNGIDNLRSDINDAQIVIENLKLSEEAMHSITVILPPFVPAHPIGSSKMINILAAGLAGLVAGIFAAFFVEFWPRSPA